MPSSGALSRRTGLGHFEPAAVVLGKAKSMPDSQVHDWFDELLAEAEAILHQELEERQLATLAVGGAELDTGDVVAYLRRRGRPSAIGKVTRSDWPPWGVAFAART